MADDPSIVPTPDQIVGKAIDRLVELRPESLKHINYNAGVWAHIFNGLRAQAALMTQRLASGAADFRLPTATGLQLLELVESEFDVSIPRGPTTAIGNITLHRTGPKPAGVIRKGSKFSRAGDPTASPVPTQSASYETIEDTYVALGATSVMLRLQASGSGSFANHILFPGAASGLAISTQLFDRSFTCDTYLAAFSMAGGSDGLTDTEVVRLAKALAVGQYGPTDAATIAGCFQAGARHVAIRDDADTGISYAYVADHSWAWSPYWLDSVSQGLSDNEFRGFGCRIFVHHTLSNVITVSATVMLRDPNFLKDTTNITAAIQRALTRYFNDRDDWYTWNLTAIEHTIARAHPRILTCTTASVLDAASGTPIVAPPSVPFGDRFLLPDNSFTPTYIAPL